MYIGKRKPKYKYLETFYHIACFIQTKYLYLLRRKSESLLMRKFTLFIFLLFLLFTSVDNFAQSGKRPLIVENEVTQIVLTITGSTVRVQNAEKGNTLEIYNILGVKVSSIKIDSSDKTIALNLPKGCYILKIGDVVRKIAIK